MGFTVFEHMVDLFEPSFKPPKVRTGLPYRIVFVRIGSTIYRPLLDVFYPENIRIAHVEQVQIVIVEDVFQRNHIFSFAAFRFFRRPQQIERIVLSEGFTMLFVVQQGLPFPV